MTRAPISLKRIALSGFFLILLATPIAAVVGFATNESAGLYAALLGFGIAILFTGFTSAVALLTKKLSAQALGVVVLGSWLLKVVLLIIFLVWLRGEEFYHRPTLLFSLLSGLTLYLLVESLITLKSKEIYVNPN